MKSHGFKCNRYDENFYMKTVRGGRIFFLVYVGDILIVTNKKTDIDWLLRAMNKDWEVKDLGPISRYLKMRFTENSRHVYIDQAPYLRALLEPLKVGKCNPLSTPMVNGPFPKKKNNCLLLNVKEQSICKSLVGRLLWGISLYNDSDNDSCRLNFRRLNIIIGFIFTNAILVLKFFSVFLINTTWSV